MVAVAGERPGVERANEIFEILILMGVGRWWE